MNWTWPNAKHKTMDIATAFGISNSLDHSKMNSTPQTPFSSFLFRTDVNLIYNHNWLIINAALDNAKLTCVIYLCKNIVDRAMLRTLKNESVEILTLLFVWKRRNIEKKPTLKNVYSCGKFIFFRSIYRASKNWRWGNPRPGRQRHKAGARSLGHPETRLRHSSTEWSRARGVHPPKK